MNRPRFLADHDLNEHIVAGVMRLHPEIEFVRVRDVGLADSSDLDELRQTCYSASASTTESIRRVAPGIGPVAFSMQARRASEGIRA